MVTAKELPIDTSASADQMADAIFGDGVKVVSSSYTGAGSASGIYTDGDSTAPGVTPSDTGVILSTGKATSITNSSGDVNKVSYTSTNHKGAGDDDLDEIAGTKTHDASVLEAKFIPQGDILTMQVTFSSEEYLEYVGSGFNDAVGIFVNGEKAELTVGDGDITINNINDTSNENLYLDNSASADVYNTEVDGLTVTMTLKAPVNPGEVNTIKIGIADGGDGYYDSNLLIAGDSVQSALVAGDDSIFIDGTKPEDLDVLANDHSATGSELKIIKINDQPVSAGDTITLATGESVTLNGDGTLTFVGDGDEESNILTYTVADEDGNTDVGYIELTTAPCFVAGTRIETPSGPVPVEALRPGDLVCTLDNGAQPVRWVGGSTFVALGAHAPITIAAGALGGHDRVEVSANHRIAVSSPAAEMLLGSAEVFIKAAHLVDGRSVRRRETGRAVTYVHILFDRHQIVCAHGLWSESFHPGTGALGALDPVAWAQILALMPAADHLPGFGYGPTARPTLKRYEARLVADVPALIRSVALLP